MLSPLPAHADATLVVQGSDGLQSTIQLRNGRGKMSASGMDAYIIYDAGAGTVTYVEPQERRYTQISEDALAATESFSCDNPLPFFGIRNVMPSLLSFSRIASSGHTTGIFISVKDSIASRP